MSDGLGPLPSDVLNLDGVYPGMALADQVRAYAAQEVTAERERCTKAAHAAIHSVHPAMRQSADIMMNAVNKAIGYPIQP